MSQGLRYARMCVKGWTSTRDAIMGGCGNTPLARWSEWSCANSSVLMSGVYFVDGKRYQEKTRSREVRNDDLRVVTIKERRLVRVK